MHECMNEGMWSEKEQKKKEKRKEETSCVTIN
jgi:hypothetical protein